MEAKFTERHNTYVESDIIEAIEMLSSKEVSSGVCDL